MSVQIKGVGTIGGIDQGLDTVGVVTATSFVGTGVSVVGVVTATSFSGSGANLTSLPAQATIANNADNRVITGGSGVNLNGEANLTFDGTNLDIDSDSGHLRIGADQDLDLYHNGSNGYLKNSTGQQLYRSGTHTFENAAGSTEYLRIGSAGQIGLGGANYGSSGQVLTSQGSGSAVQWASPSSHTLLHTVSLDLVSAGSNTKTQALNLSGYLKLYGLITGVQRSTQLGDIWLTFNGSNTNGQYAWIRSYVDNGGAVATTGSQNGIAYSNVGPGFFGNIAGVNAYTSGNNYWAFTLHGIQENGKVYESHSVGYLNNNMVVNTTGYFQQSAAITSIAFNVHSSTWRTSGGTMKLYGVK